GQGVRGAQCVASADGKGNARLVLPSRAPLARFSAFATPGSGVQKQETQTNADLRRFTQIKQRQRSLEKSAFALCSICVIQRSSAKICVPLLESAQKLLLAVSPCRSALAAPG